MKYSIEHMSQYEFLFNLKMVINGEESYEMITQFPEWRIVQDIQPINLLSKWNLHVSMKLNIRAL
jgi:hypothetical protein